MIAKLHFESACIGVSGGIGVAIPLIAQASDEKICHLHENTLARLNLLHAGKLAAIWHVPLGLPAERVHASLSRVLLLVKVNVIGVAWDEPMVKKLMISDIEAVFIVGGPKVVFVYHNTTKEKVIAADKPIDDRFVEVALVRRSGLPTELATDTVLALNLLQSGYDFGFLAAQTLHSTND
ncbi:MAG: hypothetical protein Q4B54_11420 [Coriobacteriales bacterium]|nr:hypothetical protein [Coriobacteriales bacterium]